MITNEAVYADLLAAAIRALDFMPSGQPETRLLREAIAKARQQGQGRRENKP